MLYYSNSEHHTSNLLIQIQHLTKSFGNFTAVNDLSFSVKEGDVHGFLGQNGAGKSTTIRMILSLIRPSSGTIRIMDKDLSEQRNQILREVGAVVEKPDLYKYLSAYENMRIFSLLSGIHLTRAEIMYKLGVVGLEQRAGDKVKVYSQGMKQRLGIAVAMVHDPKLIILDEPTNGLDPQGIADIRNLIIQLSKELKKTVLVSSHLLSEVELIADSMLIIHKGKKIVEGSVSELLDPALVQVEINTLNNLMAKAILAESQWEHQIQKTDASKIILELRKQEIADLSAWLIGKGVGLTALHTSNRLENYFLSLTSEHAAN